MPNVEAYPAYPSRETAVAALRARAKLLRERAARVDALADFIGPEGVDIKNGSPEEYALWELALTIRGD